MDAENLPGSSTDIWTKSLIEKYEDRHPSLETISFAQFAAWYVPTRNFVHEDNHINPESEDDDDTGGREVKGGLCKRRQISRIIRYRLYDKEDMKNHKREMMLLHVPFRNELVEVLDREKFLERLCSKIGPSCKHS